jgi:hypothetical protein
MHTWSTGARYLCECPYGIDMGIKHAMICHTKHFLQLVNILTELNWMNKKSYALVVRVNVFSIYYKI